MTHNEISGSIIGAAIRIHRQLGPGLLESVYQAILAHELGKAGLDVRTEVAVPVLWDSIRFDVGFRADLIVQDAVIVELKIGRAPATGPQEATSDLPSAGRQAIGSADQLRGRGPEGWSLPHRQ